MPKLTDRDVEVLANYSQTIKDEYTNEDNEIWTGSPFAWIKTRPSRQRGTICEKLISGYLACKGFDVTRSPDSEADRLINGRRAEIKSSTLWKGGFYKFQQLRKQNYDFVICLGLSPYDAHCWILPKALVLDQWRKGAIKSQHGGAEGRDTAWLDITPGSEPEWLQPWGNRLSDATTLLTESTGRRPLA